MVLIFAHHNDAEAQLLCDALKRGDGLPVHLIAPEALGVDYTISLQLKNNGDREGLIKYSADGTTVRLSEASYAINRLGYIRPLVWDRAEPSEKSYATSEINAFFPALIHSLRCPVDNPIHNGALDGEGGFSVKWALHLKRYGIPVHPLSTECTGKVFEELKSTPASHVYRVLYINSELILPPAQERMDNYQILEESILAKARDETLELVFAKQANSPPAFIHVSKTPALSHYGTRITSILAKYIKELRHDHTYGHTQRNALATAHASLHGQEHSPQNF